MKILVFLAVFFYMNSSSAYSIKANTPCILCNTVIRCGPGIDDVIRPSGKMMTVEQYCAKNSNQRDSKYQSILNVFNNKTRFTYGEYMQKTAILDEKNLSIEAKPLIHSTDLVNITNENDLQNYTEYVLDAIDPKNDKNLEVQKDGTLVTKLDTQPKEVKKDYNDRNSRMPASKRNGVWESPEDPRYINPLKDTNSKQVGTKKFVTPTPTPYETTTIIIEDSFKRDYCKGKSTADCNDLWQKYNVKEETKKVIEKEPVKRTPASTYAGPPSFNSNVVDPSQVAQPSYNTTSSPTKAYDTTTKSAPVAVSPKATTTSNFVAKGASTNTNNSNSYDRVSNTATKLTPLKLQSQVSTRMARIGALNTSPVYRKLAVATPYGTLVNVRLQPSGNLFESDRPICESLDTWRSTSMLIATLKESDPNSEMLVKKGFNGNTDILNSDNYCIGNEQRVEACKFGEARASCSCADYGRQYFLDACDKKFTIKKQIDTLNMVQECQDKLKSIITNNENLGGDVSVNKKFAAPYAISLGETFLCLDIPKDERKTCSDHIDKKFASMSDEECIGLTKALGPNAKEYLESKDNQVKLKTYEWHKLYQHYGKEFKGLFGEVDLGIKIPEVSPKQCKQKIKGILEKVVSDLNEEYNHEVADMNPNWLKSLVSNDKKVKAQVSKLCNAQGCKDIFTSFRDDKKNNKDKSAAMVSEMKEVSSFYRDLSLHMNLNYSHCGQSRVAPTPIPNLLQQKNYQQSPLPGEAAH